VGPSCGFEHVYDTGMDGVHEAVGVLGAARVDGLDAEAALGLVLAARHAQAAALAVEADALARLERVLPGGRAAWAGR
jgi:hypothetical protein